MSKFKRNRFFTAKFIPLYGPYNALSMGKKIPTIAHFPWDFVTLPEEDRTRAIGNMHKRFGSGQTDTCINKHTHTHTYSLQYFVTVPAAEVMKCYV